MQQRQKSLAEIIRSARTKKGLTQKKLAKEIGVSDIAVVSWESGKYQPSGDTLLKLLDVLDIIPEIFPELCCLDCGSRRLGKIIHQGGDDKLSVSYFPSFTEEQQRMLLCMVKDAMRPLSQEIDAVSQQMQQVHEKIEKYQADDEVEKVDAEEKEPAKGV